MACAVFVSLLYVASLSEDKRTGLEKKFVLPETLAKSCLQFCLELNYVQVLHPHLDQVCSIINCIKISFL